MKVIDFVGFRQRGKTTLVEQLVTLFCRCRIWCSGYKRVPIMTFQVDKPGKARIDFTAGAQQVIVKNDQAGL